MCILDFVNLLIDLSDLTFDKFVNESNIVDGNIGVWDTSSAVNMQVCFIVAQAIFFDAEAN